MDFYQANAVEDFPFKLNMRQRRVAVLGTTEGWNTIWAFWPCLWNVLLFSEMFSEMFSVYFALPPCKFLVSHSSQLWFSFVLSKNWVNSFKLWKKLHSQWRKKDQIGNIFLQVYWVVYIEERVWGTPDFLTERQLICGRTK